MSDGATPAKPGWPNGSRRWPPSAPPATPCKCTVPTATPTSIRSGGSIATARGPSFTKARGKSTRSCRLTTCSAIVPIARPAASCRRTNRKVTRRKVQGPRHNKDRGEGYDRDENGACARDGYGRRQVHGLGPLARLPARRRASAQRLRPDEGAGGAAQVRPGRGGSDAGRDVLGPER